MNQFSQNFGKFLFPGTLLITGLVILITGGVQGQNAAFMLAGVAVLVVGVIALLYAMNVISKQIQTISSIAMIVISIALGFYDYRSVKDDLDFTNAKKEIYSEVIQRLKDIRTAQLAHKKYNGNYAPNFDSLITYITEGKLPIITAIGSIPDSLDITEEEAIEQGIIIRDTMMVSVLENIFLSEDAQKDRDYRFQLDSLRYAPKSGVEFYMKTDLINQGGMKAPVLLLKDMKPFDPTDTLMVGSLVETNTSGNWSGE